MKDRTDRTDGADRADRPGKAEPAAVPAAGSDTLQRAVLVSVDIGAYDAEVSLAELSELARTAGAEVLATVSQKRQGYDRATLIGSGRLEEIKEFAEANEANLLIFDHELSASQIRNIADKVGEGVAVIDRTMLILDIFAKRAHTHEGRLQVELAQLRYRLPRLAGQGKALSRLGGGIGTRGPGETKLESDRRHIRRRIEALEAQLAKLENHRKHLRARRKKDEVTTVAIVGYTNVGKSTLLNTLTDAGVLAEDMLFATLDPTARALALPDGRQVMLIDTVGLVRRLPHQLVRAFHSTLEEAALADLLLVLCDISSPDAEEQIAVTKDVMRELGVTDTPMLTVLNQSDKTEYLAAAEELHGDVLISAKTGQGLEALLAKIAEALPPTHTEMTLLLPYRESGLLAEIRGTGKILSEAYEEDGTRVTALVDHRIRHKAEPYRVRK
ncbi:MAG: GTPase HflX [Clostridiales Family XIII bacterium]|jgi:GTP-binding protein HflX|nr:GTPase HflX [Clostridiales Family XIII bacterium]